VFALDADTGKIKWKYNSGGSVWSSPTVSSGVVYVGSYDNHVYAIYAATGKLKWKYETSARVAASPSVSGDTVYVGSWSDMYALDAATGKLKWSYAIGCPDCASPAVSGSIVYVGSSNYYIYALDAATGNYKWNYETGSHITSSPAVSGGNVYVSSVDGYVYAFSGSSSSTGAITHTSSTSRDASQTFATNTAQQSKTSKIFPTLLIIGLLCVVGYVLISSAPEGGWTAEKLIDAVKYKYYRSESGMQMSNKNARLWPGKKVGSAIGGAIGGAIISAIAWSVMGSAEPEVGGAIIGGIIGAIIGAIGGAICGAFASREGENFVGAGFVGGIGSAVIFTVLAVVDGEGIWTAVSIFIGFGIIGAIMGAIAGAVGNWSGGVTNKMREKQLQYLKTVPGLFDTAKSLFTQANTLFKQKNYTKALQTYNDALSNFTKASEGARSIGDTDLVSVISKNITAIRKNIISCKNSIGAEITVEARSKFGNGDFDDALQRYKESLRYLEDPELVAKAEDNIESCYREIDARKVEELSNRAISLLNEAASLNEPFKARDILKQADDVIEKAVTIAMKRKFTEAHQRLNVISRNIRIQRGVIDDRMAGGGEVVPGAYDVRTVTGKAGPSVPTIAPEQGSIEIVRGYEVLPNNDLRFGIRVINPTDYVILDVETILDYPESLFNLKGEVVQTLNNIHPNGKRTATYILTPLDCIHNEKIDAIVRYKDHTDKTYIVQMRPKETHCVVPYLKEKAIREGEFAELATKSKSINEGISFVGIGTSEIADFVKESCTHGLYTVGEHKVDNTIVLDLAGESLGEKAYYLLTAVIHPYKDKGVTQMALRAYSDKPHGLHGFLNEITERIRHLVGSVQSAREIGIIENKQVINIIDSVVQKTIIGGIGDGTGATSVNIKDSIVHRSQVGSARRCPNCGKSVEANEKFCTDCGGRLG
jgi:glycine betaine/proline transport system substrate-binding protein